MTDQPPLPPALPFSVLMAVYHGDTPDQLIVALESVACHQTTLPSELVIVMDGPISAELRDVIENIEKASRVKFKLIELPENKGLAFALNEGLRHCEYEWVARMDADDYAIEKRFETSLEFIQNNPHISVFGTQIGESTFEAPESFMSYRSKTVPTEHVDIVSYMCFRNPMNHPSVFFKKSVIIAAGGYPIKYPEDYFLWITLVQQGYQIANMPDTLIIMRTNNTFFKRRSFAMLKGELAVYLTLYRGNYISLPKLWLFSILRIVLRLGGWHITRWAYYISRKKNEAAQTEL